MNNNSAKRIAFPEFLYSGLHRNDGILSILWSHNFSGFELDYFTVKLKQLDCDNATNKETKVNFAANMNINRSGLCFSCATFCQYRNRVPVFVDGNHSKLTFGSHQALTAHHIFRPKFCGDDY